jgi:DNA-binding transcriptional MerR regulator/effector-binding domain-containing protein
MYRIGEFSRFALVSTRTLRLYDELGLLKPEKQDQFTGYRYYSASQLARLNRILVLKDMGLMLDQIKDLLDTNITPDQIRGMLRLKQLELHRQIMEGQEQLERIEGWLKQIDENNLNLDYQVTEKAVPPLQVASITTVVADVTRLPELFEEITNYLSQHKLRPAAAPLALFYDEEYKETDLKIEAAIPIAGPLAENDRIKVRKLPGIKLVASAVHTGPLESLGRAFGALSVWIEANDYAINGPNREIFLKLAPSDDAANFLTEVQFPIVKKKAAEPQ